jgi:hypothetical protein
MKISKTTLKILKNFQNINRSLIVKSGNTLKTLSDAKTLYAIANVDETFPDFAIYDLSKLLSIIELSVEPDYIFYDSYLQIVSDRQKTKYLFSEPSILNLTLPTKDICLPDILVEFMISQDDLVKIDKASNKLTLPDLVIRLNDDGELVAVVCDKKNSYANSYTILLEQSKLYNASTIPSLNFKIESLKLLSGDYWVEISKAKLSKFTNQDIDLTYFMALEEDSVTE